MSACRGQTTVYWREYWPMMHVVRAHAEFPLAAHESWWLKSTVSGFYLNVIHIATSCRHTPPAEATMNKYSESYPADRIKHACH